MKHTATVEVDYWNERGQARCQRVEIPIAWMELPDQHQHTLIGMALTKRDREVEKIYRWKLVGTTPEYRWVWGTSSQRWHLVGPGDRDYDSGIAIAERNRMTDEQAKALYLQPRMVGSNR